MVNEKINTNVRIDKELRENARKHGLVLSTVLSNALKEIIEKLEK